MYKEIKPEYFEIENDQDRYFSAAEVTSGNLEHFQSWCDATNGGVGRKPVYLGSALWIPRDAESRVADLAQIGDWVVKELRSRSDGGNQFRVCRTLDEAKKVFVDNPTVEVSKLMALIEEGKA